MKVAVLPFNAAEGTKPALGRQFAAFAAEHLRNTAEAEINVVNYLTQVQQEVGVRVAYVNLSDGMLPYDQLKDLFEQADVELVQDGFLKEEEGKFLMTLRYHEKGNSEPVREEEFSFAPDEIFSALDRVTRTLNEQGKFGASEEVLGALPFGTQRPDAFLKFLEGFDSLSYVQQAEGQVAMEFSPEGGLNALLEAYEADRSFEGAYSVLVQLARVCGQYQIGTYEMLQSALDKAIALNGDAFPAYFVKGELAQAVGQLEEASNNFEKAIQRSPDDAGILSRLGVVQLQMGMPVNAERNFRKALELEGEDKPSADYLAAVLQQTGRDHEIPGLWKEILDKNPQDGGTHAKYAISLINAGKKEEGERAFETALEVVEENAIVKRYFAPYLANEGDLDRAMDFYEDALDVAPADVPTLLEYAETLEKADRSFEVPNVLKQVLQANPDVNIRAQALARLIELEQPKRVETVDSARERMENGDFESAIRELKPLRNWLADYWKMWALLASAYNNTGQFAEAEEASQRLLELFPAYEPGFGELVQSMTQQGEEKAQQAFQIMQQVAAMNPQSLGIHINLGLAAVRSGNEEVARNIARSIREAIGSNPEAQQQLEPVLQELEA